MKIVVIGDTHNAWVTAYCLAKLDHGVTLISDSSNPQIAECGPVDLQNEGVRIVDDDCIFPSKSFDFAWVAHDTPLDKTGAPNVAPLYYMLNRARYSSTKLVLSSQVPLGFCRQQLELYDGDHIAYVPENMRIGKGIEGFLEPDRLVVGAMTQSYAWEVAGLLGVANAQRVPWILTTLETAEMIKHATNAFLATSISLANELAEIGKPFKVDMDAVTKALRADSRIGLKAYVEAGRPFTGGTLKRDLRALQMTAAGKSLSRIVDAVLYVNADLEGSS